MEQEKQLIIPTDNLVFGVLKDDTFVSNLKNEKGDFNPTSGAMILHHFVQLIKTLTGKELAAFALAWIIERGEIERVLLSKLKED